MMWAFGFLKRIWPGSSPAADEGEKDEACMSRTRLISESNDMAVTKIAQITQSYLPGSEVLEPIPRSESPNAYNSEYLEDQMEVLESIKPPSEFGVPVPVFDTPKIKRPKKSSVFSIFENVTSGDGSAGRDESINEATTPPMTPPSTPFDKVYTGKSESNLVGKLVEPVFMDFRPSKPLTQTKRLSRCTKIQLPSTNPNPMVTAEYPRTLPPRAPEPRFTESKFRLDRAKRRRFSDGFASRTEPVKRVKECASAKRPATFGKRRLPLRMSDTTKKMKFDCCIRSYDDLDIAPQSPCLDTDVLLRSKSSTVSPHHQWSKRRVPFTFPSPKIAGCLVTDSPTSVDMRESPKSMRSRKSVVRFKSKESSPAGKFVPMTPHEALLKDKKIRKNDSTVSILRKRLVDTHMCSTGPKKSSISFQRSVGGGLQIGSYTEPRPTRKTALSSMLTGKQEMASQPLI